MLFALIVNTEESQSVRFIKGTEVQAIETFNSEVATFTDESQFVCMLVNEDELTQANLTVQPYDGLCFDSTIIYLRYVDKALELDEIDYVIHA